MDDMQQFAPNLRSTKLEQPLSAVRVRQRRLAWLQPLDLVPKKCWFRYGNEKTA